MSQTNRAREEILRRIREALQDVPTHKPVEPVMLARDYRHSTTDGREEIIERFAERVADYKVTVQRVQAGDLARTIALACAARGVQRLVVPADLPANWLPADVTVLRDDNLLSYEQLDACDGVLTGCLLGIAQTGTIILDGGTYQGRRAITLLPDYHLCLIPEEQIVDLVPEAILQIKRRTGPLTFISGPSATSDIELNRVEGVHGPRTLDVLIVGS